MSKQEGFFVGWRLGDGRLARGELDWRPYGLYTKVPAGFDPAAAGVLLLDQGHDGQGDLEGIANLSGADLKRANFDAFFAAIDQGINLVSLPLMPTQEFTARDMLNLTDATLIIRYNREDKYFEGFTSGFKVVWVILSTLANTKRSDFLVLPGPTNRLMIT